MKIFLTKTSFLFKEIAKGFINDNVLKLSAALSYYTIFSLPPLLIIIITLSGLFFGADAVRGEVFQHLSGVIGNNAALQIQETIKNVKLMNSNVFITILGVLLLLVGASSLFSEIQDSINLIWGIKAKDKRGLMKFIYNRIMSFTMIGLVGILLLADLIINWVIAILNNRVSHLFHHSTLVLFSITNSVIVFVVITILFSLIFKTLPDGKITYRDCIISAAFTAFLFTIGKIAIGYYLTNFNIASIYGAAGSVILILAWVYYSAIILYVGAEFTKVFANTFGDKIFANEYSSKVGRK